MIQLVIRARPQVQGKSLGRDRRYKYQPHDLGLNLGMVLEIDHKLYQLVAVIGEDTATLEPFQP